jgi:hypothetical protein
MFPTQAFTLHNRHDLSLSNGAAADDFCIHTQIALSFSYQVPHDVGVSRERVGGVSGHRTARAGIDYL